MPRLRYTGGSRYALRGGPTWSEGDVREVDEVTADRLGELDKFEQVDSADGPADDGSRGYETMTYEEVYERAAEADIDGRSSMTKAELIDALEGDG